MRWIILVFTSLLLFFSCKKIERINPVDGIVGVQTSAVQQLDLSSVQIGTTLQTTEEVTYVTQRGVCWSTNPNPTTTNDFVAQGSGFGTFQSKITGLSGNTKYYFRSFASNEKTTAYGNEVSHTIKAPVLLTKTAVDISYTSAKIGGELINNNGIEVVEYGIYWGVFPGISPGNSKLKATQKDFYLDLTELENGKTYYYRTFAQTNLGIAYGEVLSFTTSSNTNVTITDIDGNTYKKVTIGTQTWMAENLKTSRYNDGTVIPNITVKTNWTDSRTGAWSYYNNDSVYNSKKYGKLYNWYAVSPTTNGNKNICPTGWHVPTDPEWAVLMDYLGGLTVAGSKMKEEGTTNWISPNTDAINTSLFTGLPGGFRNYFGEYGSIGNFGGWWSSTQSNTGYAWGRYLSSSNGNAYRNDYMIRNGLSVRCLRD